MRMAVAIVDRRLPQLADLDQVTSRRAVATVPAESGAGLPPR